MQSSIRQFDKKLWPVFTGPIVVSAHKKIIFRKPGNRDGPLIFHMRDGPPNVTGPPGGTGPPEAVLIEAVSSGTSPPKTTDPPMEWLVRKKILKKFLKNKRESL